MIILLLSNSTTAGSPNLELTNMPTQLSAYEVLCRVKGAAVNMAGGEQIVVKNIPVEFAHQVITSVETDPMFSENPLR